MWFRKNIFITVFCHTAIFWTSSAVQAEKINQYDVHIKYLGSHAGQIFYLKLDEPFSVPCKNGVIYCPKSNTNCINYYPIAVSAKITDKPLSRVTYDYNIDTDQMCYFWLLEID